MLLHYNTNPWLSLRFLLKKGKKTTGTSAQGLTMTIPPALTMLPETGRVTVTVPWPLLVVLVLAPPACTIWAPAKLAAGIVIIPAHTLSSQFLFQKTTPQCSRLESLQSRRQTQEIGENWVYPAAGQCHLHWLAGRRWFGRQPSVPPAGPARWSAAPLWKGRHSVITLVINWSNGHSNSQIYTPGSVQLWWLSAAAGWWSAGADPADPGAGESDRPAAGSDLAAPAGSTHGHRAQIAVSPHFNWMVSSEHHRMVSFTFLCTDLKHLHIYTRRKTVQCYTNTHVRSTC